MAAFLCSLSGEPAAAQLQRLVAEADAIAAVEIASTDYSATPADGPMYAVAKVLKAVKGPMSANRSVQFGATAWVGPTYRTGERRIVFLRRLPARHNYYQKARWGSLEAGEADLFFDEEELPRCSESSLTAFLARLEEETRQIPSIETAATRVSESVRLSVKLENRSPAALWLNLLRMHLSFEANQVRRALAMKWDRPSQSSWIALQPGQALIGSASLRPGDVSGVDQITVTIRHQSALYPHRSWLGMRTLQVRIEE